jgi:type IV pilus assembly protein PilW
MRRRAGGFSLLELLIALTLSLALIAASFGVLHRCRGLFASNEGLAQIQDAARQALATLVEDIEHAGFYGLAPATAVQFVAGGAVVASGDALRQFPVDRAMTTAASLPAGVHDCGVNFAVDLARPVQGTDNGYALGDGGCEPTSTAGGARAGSDTLTIRRASPELTTPRAGRLQVHSRAASPEPLRLFADGRDPAPPGTESEIRDLEVRSYYVANRSVGNPRLPALRARSVTESRGAIQYRDEEVMPGVEDLQVEFGVMTDDGGEAVLRYVTPDSPEADSGAIVAVRLWLRVRAETADAESGDAGGFDYSNSRFTPDRDESRFRRLLVTRTVALRNGP